MIVLFLHILYLLQVHSNRHASQPRKENSMLLGMVMVNPSSTLAQVNTLGPEGGGRWGVWGTRGATVGGEGRGRDASDPPVISGPVSMSSELSRSHHLTVRSAELVAKMNSEGWYSMAVMASSCLNSCSSLPAVSSHTYIYTHV